MTLDQLKQDLFERFIRAFDEFNRIAEKKAKAQFCILRITKVQRRKI